MQKRARETRAHIIRESRRLFTANGFAGTSISDIIGATGVKKGNLYYHFGSKEELGVAVLEDARDEFFRILAESLTGREPRTRIVNSCRTIMELMRESDFVGGCLFGNTALEMTDRHSRFGRIIREVFDRWRELLEQELAREKKRAVPLDDRVLATAIVAILEGGIMLARVYRSGDRLKECIETVAALLEPDRPGER